MKYAACEKCAQSVGKINIAGNVMMILIKGYMGVVGGSKGLIADAVHSCADLLATIVMMIGLHISGREKDDNYPYGYGKAEYLVAVVIYLFLFVIGSYILFDGTKAILEGRRVTPCLSAAWGAIFSIAINELMFRQSICAGNQINSPSMTAKAWESRSDVLSSVAVLIGIIGAKMGFHFMDPLAAIIVGVIILRVCVEQIKNAVKNLMDGAAEEGLDEVREALGRVADILNIAEINSREVGQELELEIRLGVREDITVIQGETIKRETKQAIREAIDRKLRIKIMLFPVSCDA
ncbi:MAG TPA: cation transporter [Deltaproteobacteria bacterium]|nr:cation transporter [Deltaproteobacteria bacterium]HIJ39641.1 cation transporter [Deltaproteobacteria bacterium]